MLKYGFIATLIFFAINISNAQSSCCAGYEEGYKRGYSYPNMNMANIVSVPSCRCYAIIGGQSYNDGFALGFKDGQQKKEENRIPEEKYPSNKPNGVIHRPYVYSEYISPFPADAYLKLQNQINAKLVDAQFLKSKGDEIRQIALDNWEKYGPYLNNGIKQWYYNKYQQWRKAEKESQDKSGVTTNTYDMNSLFSFMNYRIKLWSEFINNTDVIWAINVGRKSEVTTNLLIGYIETNGNNYNNPFGQEIKRISELMTVWLKSNDWTTAPEIDLQRITNVTIEPRTLINFPANLTKINFYDIKPKHYYDTIFSDKFNKNSYNWDVGAETDEYSAITNGTYILKNYSKSSWHWFTKIINVETGINAKSIYGTARFLSAANEVQRGTGLIIGSTSYEAADATMLIYNIYPTTKYYQLALYKNSEWTTLISGTTNMINSESINEISFYLEKNGIVLIANKSEIQRYNFSGGNHTGHGDNVDNNNAGISLAKLGSVYGFYLGDGSSTKVLDFSVLQEK